MSYPKIAKRMKLAVSTVFNACRRFENDGYRFVDRRKTNFQSTWQRNERITGAVKDFLLSHEVLSEWARYNLDQRVK
jgi:transposase